MRRISSWAHEQIIEYNLRDNGTAVTIFADAQTARVERARAFVRAVLGSIQAPATIWELGCSAGDIGGFFSPQHQVTGIDVVPAAIELCKSRYPGMTAQLAVAQDLPPVPCDILILTEFLEHIAEPIALVEAWLPLAKFSIIGHPINDPGGIEPGHIWSYDANDYYHWLALGGHRPLETHFFAGPFPEMVMGVSQLA